MGSNAASSRLAYQLSLLVAEQPRLHQKGIGSSASQDIKAGRVASKFDCTLNPNSLMNHKSKLICLAGLFNNYCAD